MRGKRAQLIHNNKGFTLVEVLIAIVVVALLAAVLLPSLTGYIKEAQRTPAMLECRTVVQAAKTELLLEYKEGNRYAEKPLSAQMVSHIMLRSEAPGSMLGAMEIDSANDVRHLTYLASNGLTV
ncbi:prepilin-type N-terminal cleavage/methylation domain-containing protein, partial [Christensenellaceae bacterium OttesenSCG-928-L17]|nr:prepilin-type N-terminal cleavage/methylation domain-containing protein [Christensenellaceae bacterium OttesenSCG-928-L17]